METELTLPRIEYEQHPAYRDGAVGCLLDDGVVSQLTDAIDDAYARLRSEAEIPVDKVSGQFGERIDPRLAELERYVLSANFRPELHRMTKQAISWAGRFLLEQAIFHRRQTQEGTRISPLPSELEGQLEKLQVDGYYQCPVNRDLAATVWRQTWWERSVLRKRAQQSPSRHCAIALDVFSPAVARIRRALSIEKILPVVSRYMGCEMEWLYAALDFSHDRQTWYKGCYSDAGLPTAKTVYMHFDADSDIVKAMLYLSDVDETAGPFRYVSGSHRWRRSPFLFALHKGFDVEQTKMFEMETDGLDYKLGYYRPRFLLKEHRQDLLTLPSVFRGTTHFGDDIVDGSNLSDQLLAREKTFLGPAGTLIVFDGSSGIHRGSQVERGERWAVQIAMRAVCSRQESPASGIRTTKGRIRYCLSRIKNVVRPLILV